MGLYRYRTIALSSKSETGIKWAHKVAVEMFGELVSGIVMSELSCGTFIIAPDGGKE